MTDCKYKISYGNWGRTRGCERPATKDGFCTIHHPDYAEIKEARQEAAQKKRDERTLNLEMARAIALLKKNGYTVTKEK